MGRSFEGNSLATLRLAEVLRVQVKFAESLKAYRRGNLLHSKKAVQKWSIGAWVKDAERLMELDNDLAVAHRYLAARAAVRAAGGVGQDASFSPAVREQRRRQALDWLRADLALWRKQAESKDATTRLAVRAALNQWRTHDDLAPVCDAKALEQLSEIERHDGKSFGPMLPRCWARWMGNQPHEPPGLVPPLSPPRLAD